MKSNPIKKINIVSYLGNRGEYINMNFLHNEVIYEFVAEPCRNFNILCSILITDPRDGKEKVILSNFVSGSTGSLIFLDVETGEGETVRLPSDSGAWAIYNLNNDKIIVGTCPNYGYIYCLDLKSRSWSEGLRIESEKYIWNLTLGSDGFIYGGTYPGCTLIRYNPKQHILENMGRVSDNPKNLYSRTVYGGLPEYILISGGCDTPFLSAWNIKDHSINVIVKSNSNILPIVSEITDEFIRIAIGDELSFYDPKTFELINDISIKDNKQYNKLQELRLGNGNIFGVRGQDYYEKKNGAPVLDFKKIPTLPPPTNIHTIINDKNGNIWGACGFGQTIFRYNPNEKSYWNSSTVCDHGGEVYGMVFVDEKLFMTAYSRGDHIVYDTRMSWDQFNNINPKTFKSLAPALIRPLGRSVAGPNDTIWTGWSANYGVYGGGLSCIDTTNLNVKYWYDPIPKQQIISVSADDKYIYFTTNGGGNGLPNNGDPCHFCVWSQEGTLIYDKQFNKDIDAGIVLAIGMKVLVVSGLDIMIFDISSLEFIDTIHVGKLCSCMVAVSNTTVLVFSDGALFHIDIITRNIKHLIKLPGYVETATITSNGEVYFSHGTVLYKIVNR